jgi:hypothetical protein
MVDSGTQFAFLFGDAYAGVKAEFLRQTRLLLPALDGSSFAFQEAFGTCSCVPHGRSLPEPRLLTMTLLFNGSEMAVAGSQRSGAVTRPCGT